MHFLCLPDYCTHKKARIPSKVKGGGGGVGMKPTQNRSTTRYREDGKKCNKIEWTTE
jgi:hypothetical protein